MPRCPATREPCPFDPGCGTPHAKSERCILDLGSSENAVTSPPHYTKGKVEVIDFIREQLGDDGFVAYCRGNVMKYTARGPHKGKAEDYAKAAFYGQMAAHVTGPFADPRP
jgi:hypothetical protein